MAVRKIVKYGTPSLREECKEVHKVSQKIKVLVKDLLDTMYVNNGVGLAAPQIGENIRMFVIDVSTGDEPLNPKIVKKSGAIIREEGCLSFPAAYTQVRRYQNVLVKALDRNGKPFVLEAKDGCLLAIAIQHENDHLNGVLFVDHAVNRFETDAILTKHKLPPIELDKIVDEPELEAELEKQAKND